MKKQVFKLKPLSKDGVESALTKAEHYRLLNSPKLAESICLDILEVDKDNQKARIVLLLALTDQFGQSTMTVAKEDKIWPSVYKMITPVFIIPALSTNARAM